MALYPKARVRLLPEGDPNDKHCQPRITPTQVITHTAVDGARTTSLYPFFLNSSSLESHFYVAGDGTVEQYADTEVRADANYKANARAISIETHDGWAGKSGPVMTPWNDAQVAALIELVGWLCRTHGIPTEVCPAWDAPGIGWHNLYPLWSYPGPTGCPGPVRAAQVRDVIIPALGVNRPAVVDPASTTHKESDMLAMSNADGREEIVGLSPDGSLASAWESTPGGGLGPMRVVAPTDAPKFTGIARTKDDAGNGQVIDGRLAVRLAGPFGEMWGAWQDGPGGGWKVFRLAELQALGGR